MNSRLDLHLEPDELAVCRLDPGDSIPDWGRRGPFWSLSRSAEEWSLVCAMEEVPDGVTHDGPWRALKVAGPLEFSLTGIVAGLSGPLADAGIPVFVVSTYHTDYLLVRKHRLKEALEALSPLCHIHP